jgi:hypothetical protein|tara:strand:- start:337 stop:540 length:204 start_codon:yes stop_codon:yes gene_type:complete
MNKSNTKKFIKNQVLRLRAKVRTKKEELKIFLDSAYNFSVRANDCRDAINVYENRIYTLRNEDEYNA